MAITKERFIVFSMVRTANEPVSMEHLYLHSLWRRLQWYRRISLYCHLYESSLCLVQWGGGSVKECLSEGFLGQCDSEHIFAQFYASGIEVCGRSGLVFHRSHKWPSPRHSIGHSTVDTGHHRSCAPLLISAQLVFMLWFIQCSSSLGFYRAELSAEVYFPVNNKTC